MVKIARQTRGWTLLRTASISLKKIITVWPMNVRKWGRCSVRWSRTQLHFCSNPRNKLISIWLLNSDICRNNLCAFAWGKKLRASFAEKMAFYLSCVIIATVPVYFAAVQAWIWPFYAAAMMLAYILFLWQNRLNKAKPSGLWILLGGIFFIWTLLQSVPLPAELIEKLSPFRYRALSDGATLAGIDFNPSSLS